MKKFKTLVVDTASSLVENINFVEAENKKDLIYKAAAIANVDVADVMQDVGVDNIEDFIVDIESFKENVQYMDFETEDLNLINEMLSNMTCFEIMFGDIGISVLVIEN